METTILHHAYNSGEFLLRLENEQNLFKNYGKEFVLHYGKMNRKCTVLIVTS